MSGPRLVPIRRLLPTRDAFTGRGVTVAFLDSGFFAHPDLRGRILRYVDVNADGTGRAALRQPSLDAWHGMMTCAVACGSGSLSHGRYRGLASQAQVVLVKVGGARRIKHDDIRRGLLWVLQHRERLGIRIANVSCGGDYEASYLEDRLSRAVERATAAGILVVAAAGNKLGAPVFPPASAPSALAVGGCDASLTSLYPTSHGPTADGLQKPELIAPAWPVPAPVMPGTPEFAVRRYKAVDGTSFAAPIVASVAAQMLEANPALKPQQVKRILLLTARRLSGVSPDMQGWGVVDPRAAVSRALETV